jgi:hypothetical protein
MPSEDQRPRKLLSKAQTTALIQKVEELLAEGFPFETVTATLDGLKDLSTSPPPIENTRLNNSLQSPTQQHQSQSWEDPSQDQLESPFVGQVLSDPIPSESQPHDLFLFSYDDTSLPTLESLVSPFDSSLVQDHSMDNVDYNLLLENAGDWHDSDFFHL